MSIQKFVQWSTIHIWKVETQFGWFFGYFDIVMSWLSRNKELDNTREQLSYYIYKQIYYVYVIVILSSQKKTLCDTFLSQYNNYYYYY